MKKHLNFPEIIRFAVVGFTNLGIDLAVFSVSYYWLGLPLLLANTLAYSLATANSYVLNKHWTFASDNSSDRSLQEFSRFVLFNLVGLALSNLSVYFLANYLQPIVAKLYAVGVTFVWNYITNRYFVFRNAGN